MDKRMRLYGCMMGLFVFFILLLAVFTWYVLTRGLENVDPSLTLFAGVGGGVILEAIILMLKDGWQFYFRKKGPESGGE